QWGDPGNSDRQAVARHAHPGRGGRRPRRPGCTLADSWRVTPMIAAQRQEILRLLERLSELTPDVRFGQLIANLSYLAVGPTNQALGYMEGERLVAAIRKHIADLSDRAVNVP